MDALQTRQSLLVIHSHWSDGSLKLWAESEAAIDDAPPSVEAHHAHPFAATPDELIRVLRGARAVGESATIEELELLLPAEPETRRPLASETLWARSGRGRAGEAEPVLERYRVGCVSIEAGAARRAINRLFEPGWAEEEPSFAAGPAVAFHAEVVALADHILAQHRVVPILTQRASGALHASWMPWAADDQTAGEVAKLVRAMPPVARAAIDGYSHQPWASLGEMLWQLVDESCRATLRREEMYDTVEGRSTEDPQVAWLHGLLGPSDEVDAPAAQRQEMIRRVRRWIGGLEERGASAEWRLCLRLTEPLAPLVAEEPEPGKARKAAKPTKELLWSVSFHLQAVETPELFVDAPDVWALPGDDVTIGGHRLVGPQELLLGELGRAAKYFKKLESALADPEPIEVELTTDEAYAFLRELRPVLVEQGFGVQTPTWWESPESRLGARLRLAPPSELGDADRGPEAVGRAVPRLGLSTLVDYHWEIAVGDTTLSLKEFEQIASQGSPLIRMGGRWVEVRPEDLEHAIKFIRENPGGQMKIGEAMGFAFGTAASEVGLPVLGIEAEGWLGSMLGADLGREALPVLEQPESFRGTLRPYQTRGMSWMSFMERFGFGVCLADDMGLGKTIQLLALLQSERADAEEETAAAGEGGVTGPMGPTLLVAPTSVLGNWMHESERFAPELSVLVHHGAERLQDDPFIERARRSDLVITTYAL
ncbi:MAG: SNF2 helicase-associated domain-containing protein, partial [Phycisphaerales bacterium JB037]